MKEQRKNNWNTPGTRATFKWHVLIYFIVMIIVWVIWYIGLKTGTQTYEERSRFPWPVWPMIIWAMILFYHHSAVYGERKKLPDDYMKTKQRTKQKK